MFTKHAESTIKTKNRVGCEMCGRMTEFKCSICNVRLCLFNNKKWSGTCVSAYHNDSCFGLAMGDTTMHGKKKGDWSKPTAATIKLNASRIKEIKEVMEMEEEEEYEVSN